MKKISEKELHRLKKKGGVKVKRRLGTKKKPESVAAESESLSGVKPAEQPASALPATPVIDMQPMAAMAASMAARDAQLETVVSNNTKAVESFRKDLSEMKKPVKLVSWRSTIKRADSGLIKHVDHVPMES